MFTVKLLLNEPNNTPVIMVKTENYEWEWSLGK